MLVGVIEGIKMEIIYKNIKDIKEYDNNPRKNDEAVEYVANSIKEFGFKNPIILDKDNVIIAGHTRLKAAKKLGIKEVPCIMADDLTEEQVKAFRLADNKVGEIAEWDLELLDLELIDIDMDMTEFGFEFDEEEETELNKEETKTLAEKFLVPPFGVIDTKKGYYQERKQAWKKLIKDNGEARNLKNKTALCKNLVSKNLSDVSLLDPVLSEIIITWFTPFKENNKCFDCFAGDTVFGFVSSYLHNKFTGIELRKEQVDFNNEHTNKNAVYICDDGINVNKHLNNESQDLFFSCPPYYDLEIYSDLPNDASNQNSYEDFYKIIKKAFCESIKCLKNERFAVVVASDIRDKEGNYINFCSDIKKTFNSNGMSLYNEFILYTPNVTGYLRANKQFGIHRKMIKDYQNVMVFYKGNTKNIKDIFPKIEVADIESEDV